MTQTTSGTTNFAKAVQEIISKTLEDELRAPLTFLQQGNYMKATWVKGSNGTFRYLRVPDLTVTTNSGTIAAGTQPWLTEGTTPAAEAMSFGYEEFTGGQAGRRVELTDIALEEYPLDLAMIAGERTARQAQATLDEFLARTIGAGTNVRGVNGHTGVAVVAADTLSGTEVRKTRQIMKGDNIPQFGGQESYRAFLHSDVVFDFEDDSNTGGWLGIGQYSDPSRILNGELGRYAGVTFIEHNQDALIDVNGGAGGTVDVYTVPFIGPDAYVFGDWGTVTSHVVLPGGHGDELAQVMSIGWKGRFGAGVIGELPTGNTASDPRYLNVQCASSLATNV